ncbi:aminotransferase class-III domain-containing protein [Ditylenchus destructor]|nr:aminotransferase class-III domain-containing protein [Ditylenchus destructor]
MLATIQLARFARIVYFQSARDAPESFASAGCLHATQATPGLSPPGAAMNAPAELPDLSHLWMPFTANKQFKAHPRMLAAAKGMYYTSADGRQVLDGTAGLWCVNAGHGRQEIVDAISRQAGIMDYAPGFQLGHPLAFEAATAVASFMPQGLDRVFFTNSGSESVDTALKIALAYHRSRGDGQRTRLIGRERGYHGVGFGGISVGGISTNRKTFSGALLPSVDHLPHTHNLEQNAYSKGQPAWGAHLADELERIIALHDASTIAAVIVEPMAGSTGVLIPPKGYLEKLREITSKHGILLIFDEVITAYGRLGAATASEFFGVTPDLIAMAKGVSNAAVPAGAVAVRREVHDAIVNGPAGGIEFFHGYTYSAHPLAAAAILATLDIYRREDLFSRARKLSGAFEQAAHSLKGAPHVIDVRNLGLVSGIELAPRAGAPGARAAEVFQKCFDSGLMVRYTGDIIAVSPPLIIEEAQIGQIFEQIGKALKEVA